MPDNLSCICQQKGVRAIAVCSARRGAGTTTVALGLARALERLGERTVLVDLDPMGHATAALAPEDVDAGPTLGAVLAGRWRGRARGLVRAGRAGLGLVPAVGLADLGAVLAAGAEARLADLIAGFTSEATSAVLDCPGGRPGRVSPFTAIGVGAVAQVAEPGGGVLVAVSLAVPELAGTSALVERVPPQAMLGLVVNGVRASTIGASRHDVGRRLGVPVLARVPLERPEGASAVGDALDGLAELLVSDGGLAAAREAFQVAIDDSARRDAELARLLRAELAGLAQNPDTELDSEFELGLELLCGTHVYDDLARQRDDLQQARRVR
jgi:CobQ/CobB/MinD/ParA family nucleotide binding protein